MRSSIYSVFSLRLFFSLPLSPSLSLSPSIPFSKYFPLMLVYGSTGTCSALVNLSASLLPSVAAPGNGALSAADALSTTTLPSLSSLLATTPLSSLAPPLQSETIGLIASSPAYSGKGTGEKIRSGDFFDLKELLPDNVPLIQGLQEMGAVARLSSFPPASRLREINNPLTWVHCFCLSSQLKPIAVPQGR